MAISITLAGLLSNLEPGEPRAMAYLDVVYNNQAYSWQSYVPTNITNLEQFLLDIAPRIEQEIATKEAEWTNLDPKTKIVVDALTHEETVQDIQKEEIVRPDIPDYYAKRRQHYPDIKDQLDALWKGAGSQDYANTLNNIDSVKSQFPKTYLSPQELEENLFNTIVHETQKRLDEFARTRGYDNILSACTYVNSPIQKFNIEAQYCVQQRALTWNTLYEILDEVKANTRPMPANFLDIEPLLPALAWPN